MPRRTAPPDLIADLRAALAAREESLYAVARAAGIPYPTLHRFANSGQPCSLLVAAKLAAYLGLGLQPVRSDPRIRIR